MEKRHGVPGFTQSLITEIRVQLNLNVLVLIKRILALEICEHTYKAAQHSASPV